ncbi:hypothetical protein Tco_1217957 [Tanacetum coccineum]
MMKHQTIKMHQTLNGKSKKRISTGKDGVIRILPPVTAAEIQAVEKERKAKNILLMAIPKEHMRRFHRMDDAKEIWEAIRTRFGGNANSKKMQKVVFKQQFEAFTISSSEGLEKGYDRFQQLLSQLEAHGAEVSTEDANHKFLRSLPPAWSNLAMTMRTKPDVDTLSIDDLYNNLRVFEQEIQGASKTSSSAQNVAFVSQSKSSTNKVKSGFTWSKSAETSDGLAVIQAQLNNLGREIKKVNEKVYAAQVGCEQCKGPHYTKDCPLKEEGKTLEEAYYTQFGQSMEDTLSNFMSESAKRHEENSNLTKEIRALTDAAIQDQGASIKTLEIQIGQISKIFLIRRIHWTELYTDVRDKTNDDSVSKSPFLSTARAKIDVYKRKITLRVGEERIVFTSVKPASSLIKRVYMLSLRERMELDLEARLIGETLVNQEDDLMPTIEEGEVIEEFKTRDDELDAGIDDYPSYFDYDKKIHIDCAHNFKISCMIGFKFTHAKFFPLLYVNVMSKKFIIRKWNDKMMYKGNNVIGALMNVPIFVGTFSVMTDFAVLENMDDYRDEGMGDVIFGGPFLREVGIKTRRFEGMITIYNGNDEVTYQMVRSHPRFKHHTNEQCNKIPPLLKGKKEIRRMESRIHTKSLKGSNKENTTALAISTTEAGYVSTGKACQLALWMKQALIDYDIRLDDVPIMCDNKGVIDLSKNLVQHSRTKHIEIRHHFLRDNVQKGNISIEKVASEDNIADILTKPLKREVFNYLRLGLGMMELIVDSDPPSIIIIQKISFFDPKHDLVRENITVPRTTQTQLQRNPNKLHIDDIRPELRGWELFFRENLFCTLSNRKHVNACTAYMLYYLTIKRKFNFTLMILYRMEEVKNKCDGPMPFAMILTRLYNHILQTNPQAIVPLARFTFHERVMNPLDISSNSTKERGKRVASPSASSSSSSSSDDNEAPSFLEFYKELPDDEDLTNAQREKRGMFKCLNRYFGTITKYLKKQK